MPATTFTFDLYETGVGQIDELQGRLNNMGIVFQNIIRDWAKGNVKLFEGSQGKEESGLQAADDVFWEPLSVRYLKTKRKTYPNWLMVRTGALMESLTDPSLFAQAITDMQAVFGTPLDEDAQNAAFYNRESRPTIFLDTDDRLMIQKHIYDYLSMGDEYESILFAQGLSRSAQRRETAQMDIDLSDGNEG